MLIGIKREYNYNKFSFMDTKAVVDTIKHNIRAMLEVEKISVVSEKDTGVSTMFVLGADDMVLELQMRDDPPQLLANPDSEGENSMIMSDKPGRLMEQVTFPIKDGNKEFALVSIFTYPESREGLANRIKQTISAALAHRE